MANDNQFIISNADDPYKLEANQEKILNEAKIRKGLNIVNPYWYFKPFGLKKSTFRKFLEESGINAHITRVLSDIYDTPEKPPYPVHYFRKNFAYFDPNTPNVEFLIEFLNEKREELIVLREHNKYLKAVMSQYADEELLPLQFQPMKNVKISKVQESDSNEKTFWTSTTTEEIDLDQYSKEKRTDESSSTSTTVEEDVNLGAYKTIGEVEKLQRHMRMLHK